jgi:hypothetical protein
MYQFSRAIYRTLSEELSTNESDRYAQARHELLEACERAVDRVANDRHYFARPTRSLFKDVRDLFPITSQMRVYRVIEHYMGLAGKLVDNYARLGMQYDGTPLRCHASTRKGTPCQRIPLAGNQYCPSHQHLEEGFDVTAA